MTFTDSHVVHAELAVFKRAFSDLHNVRQIGKPDSALRERIRADRRNAFGYFDSGECGAAEKYAAAYRFHTVGDIDGGKRGAAVKSHISYVYQTFGKHCRFKLFGEEEQPVRKTQRSLFHGDFFRVFIAVYRHFSRILYGSALPVKKRSSDKRVGARAYNAVGHGYAYQLVTFEKSRFGDARNALSVHRFGNNHRSRRLFAVVVVSYFVCTVLQLREHQPVLYEFAARRQALSADAFTDDHVRGCRGIRRACRRGNGDIARGDRSQCQRKYFPEFHNFCTPLIPI